MTRQRHYKDALSRNRDIAEIAQDLGLDTGTRKKEDREVYQVRNAGQGQVKVRGENQNK